MKRATKIEDYNRIPKSVEVFGRKILTKTANRLEGVYGEARYGVNEIGIGNTMPSGKEVSVEEKKVTYLHELLHFILNFTGFQQQIVDGKPFDLEQFIESIAAGIYQYEKSAKY
jgi:hypothetical protein